VDRKKRWLLGLGIAFLGVCGVTWKLTEPEPPRFRFLVGAERRYIRAVRRPEPVFTTSYFVQGSQEEVLRRAAPEVRGWNRSVSQMDSVEFALGQETLTIVGYDFGETGRPVTHVLTERPARSIDFVRAVFDEASRILGSRSNDPSP